MKTRTIILTTLALLFTATMYAQEEPVANDEMRTVFSKSDGKIDHGGYGAFSIGYTSIDNKSALIMGGRGGWLIDHHFTIGLAGYGFFNNVSNIDDAMVSDYNLTGGYGGLFLEAIIAPNNPIHLSVPVVIGAGGVTAIQTDWWNEYHWEYYNYDGAAYFVFEPGLEIEMNLVKFFRLAIGGSYRLTNGINLNYNYTDNGQFTSVQVPKDALDGFNAYLTLKFGWF